jgi:hypothetical protein
MKRFSIFVITLALSVQAKATEDLPCDNISEKEKTVELENLRKSVLQYRSEHDTWPEEDAFWLLLKQSAKSEKLLFGRVWLQKENEVLETESMLVYSCYLERSDCQTSKSFRCEAPILSGANIVCSIQEHKIFNLNCGKS